MAHPTKVWKDQPDHTTPISAAALEDLEDRVMTYSDDVAAALNTNFRGAWSSGTTYALGDGVSVGTTNYISTVGGNLNHNPVGDSGAHWSPLIPSSVLSVSSPKFATIVLTPTGSDDSAQINAAITALSGFGDVVLGPGTFLLNTATITMPRNATGFRLRGAGRGVTILLPAASVKRVIDFPRVADYDNYQNIALADFTIDASNLTLPTSNQSLIGNLINGGRGNRANFAKIQCHRITVINLVLRTTPAGGQYQAFAFGSMQGGTTVAAGSNGVNINTFAGAGTLNVVDTTGCPTSGNLRIQVTATPTGIVGDSSSASYATLSYTGKTSTTFTGVNLVSGAGTLATGYMVMEGTQNTLTDFTWEDLRVEGGNNAFTIISDRLSTSVLVGTNHYIDEINWNRLYHDCGGTRVLNDAGGGGQVGGSAQGGIYRVTNCTFKNAGDTYEFDGMQTLYMSNTVVEDMVNGVFANNFNNPVNPQSQTCIFNGVHVRVVKMQPAAGFCQCGINLGPASNQFTGFNTLGHGIVDNCTFTALCPNATGQGWFVSAARFVNKVTITNSTASHEGINDTSVGGQQARYLFLQPCGSCHITIRNLNLRTTGTTTNATDQLQPVFLGASNTTVNNANLTVDIDGVYWFYNLSGYGAGSAIAVLVSAAVGPTGVTWQGDISKVKIMQGSTSATTGAAKPIVLPTNATYPINSTGTAALVVRYCDFTAGNSSAFDISGQDAAQAARIFYYSNKWKNGPQTGFGRSTSNSYFLTGTFTTATGNQYIGGMAARVLISAGAGVTSVDISQNGGTNYDNLLTQAAAAIPQPIPARIENGDLLKLTFTTTAPTVVVLPDK